RISSEAALPRSCPGTVGIPESPAEILVQHQHLIEPSRLLLTQKGSVHVGGRAELVARPQEPGVLAAEVEGREQPEGVLICQLSIQLGPGVKDRNALGVEIGAEGATGAEDIGSLLEERPPIRHKPLAV